jgi:hypothetical protein
VIPRGRFGCEGGHYLCPANYFKTPVDDQQGCGRLLLIV